MGRICFTSAILLHFLLLSLTVTSFPQDVASLLATSCQPGSYPNSDTSNCDPCPAGQSSATGEYCVNCSPGTYSSEPGSSSCTVCLAGTYSDKMASVCTSCPTGKYNSASGSKSCDYCTSGKYASTTGSSTCTPCPDGKFSNSGSYDCSLCGSGKYSSDDHASCMLCPAGKYLSSQGASSVNECSLCVAGTFSATTGASICTSCQPGKYLSSSGGNSASLCTYCEAGKYASSTGSSSCSLCPAGKFYGDVGAPSDSWCGACTAGKYSLAGASACTPCAAGSYSPSGGMSNDQCLSCESGKYASATGSTACVNCPAGTISTVVGATTANVCIDCVAGKYATNQQCTSCPLGKYSTTVRASDPNSCVSCTQGKYGDVNGATACKLCPIGKYSNSLQATSSSTCSNCQPGTYASSQGQSVCEKCPAGKFSISQQSSCMSCPDGSLSAEGSSNCYYESTHPYVNQDNIVKSGHFYISGASSYKVKFDSRTALEACSDLDSCDSLYLTNAAGTVLFTYSPQYRDIENIVTAPQGFYVNFKTDRSTSAWGYLFTVDPIFDATSSPTPAPTSPPAVTSAPTLQAQTKSPTVKPTPVDTSKALDFQLGFKLSGLTLTQINTDESLQTILGKAVLRSISQPTTSSIVYISATASARRLSTEATVDHNTLGTGVIVVYQLSIPAISSEVDVLATKNTFVTATSTSTFSNNFANEASGSQYSSASVNVDSTTVTTQVVKTKKSRKPTPKLAAIIAPIFGVVGLSIFGYFTWQRCHTTKTNIGCSCMNSVTIINNGNSNNINMRSVVPVNEAPIA